MEEKVAISEQRPHCRSHETTKYGSVRGVMRRKCGQCLKSYTRNAPKGAPPQVKRMAVHMYLEGNGFSAIGRILGYSKTAILYWVREAGRRLAASQPHAEDVPESVPVMEFDEMWHFVQKKVGNYGFGLLMTDVEKDRSPSRAVIGIKKHSKNFLGKST